MRRTLRCNGRAIALVPRRELSPWRRDGAQRIEGLDQTRARLLLRSFQSDAAAPWRLRQLLAQAMASASVHSLDASAVVERCAALIARGELMVLRLPPPSLRALDYERRSEPEERPATTPSHEETNYITFIFRDTLGIPLEGEYVLEHPDGTLERGRLERGRIHRERVAPGQYQVHLPALFEARWSETWVELSPEERTRKVDLILEHRGMAEGASARLSVFAQHQEHSGRPLATLDVPLTTGEGPGDELTTRATWEVSGLGDLDFDDGESRVLVFRAEIGSDYAALSGPLLIDVPGSGDVDDDSSVMTGPSR